VQLFPRVYPQNIEKSIRISLSVSGYRLKAVFGYSYPVANYPAGYPTSKPDSDHLSWACDWSILPMEPLLREHSRTAVKLSSVDRSAVTKCWGTLL